MSCIEYEASLSNTENSKYINKLLYKGELKMCPQCSIPITKEKDLDGKDVGCNKIICYSCGLKWCWLCNSVNIDYDHFNSNGKNPCANKLWLGTIVQN